MTAKSASGMGGKAGTGSRGGTAARGLPAAVLLAAAVTQPGCSQKTMITVKVVTPPGAADPFMNAAMARLTLGDKQNAAAVTSGKFEVNVDIDKPAMSDLLQVVVEALDSSGAVVGRGQTPKFDSSNTDVTVYVNRQGQVGATDLRLPDDLLTAGSSRGRRDLMGAALLGRQVSPPEPAIGALLVGGAADDGSLASEALIYRMLTHQIIDAGAPSSAGAPSVPRRGGVLVASGDTVASQQALLWGGSTTGGMLLTTADKFDPGVSTLAMVWGHPDAQYADAGPPGAYAPSAGQLSALTLVCGGSGVAPGQATGDPQLAQAVVIKRNPAPTDSADQTTRLGVTRIPADKDGNGPMQAPRYQHSVTATGDGGAALIFGGLSAADSAAGMKPVAELFTAGTNTFVPFSFMPVTSTPPSRRGHIAARLRNGQILIGGGFSYDIAGQKTVLGSALIIDTAAHTVQTIPQASFLKTPRYAATVTATGGELVVCGGFDMADKAIADCEAFSADTAMATRPPIPLPSGRAGHLALTLENGLTLLVGGVDQSGAAQASVDIYTTLALP